MGKVFLPLIGLFLVGAAFFTLWPRAWVPSSAPAASSSEAHSHMLLVHWVLLPDTQGVVDHSTLILRGRVAAQRQIPGDLVKSPPTTLSTVTVTQVVAADGAARSLEGAPVALGSEVEVEELGGKLTDGCLVQPEDFVLSKVGDDVVLFLSGDFEIRGRFHPVGGYQGVVELRGGKVHPMAARTHPKSSFDLNDYENWDAADFLARISRARSRPPAEERSTPRHPTLPFVSGEKRGPLALFQTSPPGAACGVGEGARV